VESPHIVAPQDRSAPSALASLAMTCIRAGFVGGSSVAMAAYYLAGTNLAVSFLAIGIPVGWISAFVMVSRRVRQLEVEFQAPARASVSVEPILVVEASAPIPEVLQTVPGLLRGLSVQPGERQG
jgi:hypothetical protein